MRGGGSQQGGAVARSGLAGLGVAAFVVTCCGVLPLLAGALAGLALGAWLGVGAGAAALVVAVLAFVTARRRRRCALELAGQPASVRPSNDDTARKG